MKLINRLLLWQKFVVLVVIVSILVGMPFYFYLQNVPYDIDFAVVEQRGIEPLKVLLRVLQDVRTHRGLSALFLGGNEALAGKRTAKNAEVEQDIAVFDKVFRGSTTNAELVKEWEARRGEWKDLSERVNNRALTVPESFAAHTALADNLVWLVGLVSDDFKISLDPDAHTYHLHRAVLFETPVLTEALGQARAKGAGFLALAEKARAQAQPEAAGQAQVEPITAADRVVIYSLLAMARDTQKCAVAELEKV
jgi:hypothetical protein